MTFKKKKVNESRQKPGPVPETLKIKIKPEEALQKLFTVKPEPKEKPPASK